MDRRQYVVRILRHFGDLSKSSLYYRVSWFEGHHFSSGFLSFGFTFSNIPVFWSVFKFLNLVLFQANCKIDKIDPSEALVRTCTLFNSTLS